MQAAGLARAPTGSWGDPGGPRKGAGTAGVGWTLGGWAVAV